MEELYLVTAVCTQTKSRQSLHLFLTKDEADAFAKAQTQQWCRDWFDRGDGVRYDWRPYVHEIEEKRTVTPIFRSMYFVVESVSLSSSAGSMVAVGHQSSETTWDAPVLGWPEPA